VREPPQEVGVFGPEDALVGREARPEARRPLVQDDGLPQPLLLHRRQRPPQLQPLDLRDQLEPLLERAIRRLRALIGTLRADNLPNLHYFVGFFPRISYGRRGHDFRGPLYNFP